MNYPKPALAAHDNSWATLKDHLKMLIYKNHFFVLLQYPKKPKKHARILSILTLHVSSGPTACSYCSTNSWAPLMLAVKHSFCVQALPYFQGKELFMWFQKALWKLSSFRASQFAHLIWYWLLTFSLYKFIRAGPAPRSMDQLIWSLPSENIFDSLINIPCTIIYT